MDDQDRRHLDETLRALGQVGAYAARTDATADRVRPAPGSPLYGDDKKADPYRLSHATWHSLSNAVDHLGCLRTLLGDAKVIHMYAPFTVVRAALENACGAVWLLRPPHRNDRLERRLRLALADIGNSEQVKLLMGQQGPRPKQERIDQVHDIARRAGIDEARLKQKPGYSEIVKAVDATVSMNGMIEVSWKVCSGYAHGDLWTTLGASQRTEIPGPGEEGIGTFKIEANLGLLMKVTTIATAVTGLGWQLYDQRCQASYHPARAAAGGSRTSARQQASGAQAGAPELSKEALAN